MEINNFSITGIPRLLFGAGEISELPKIAAEFGKRVVLVTGGTSLKASGNHERILSSLVQARLEVHEVSVSQEPTPDMVDNAVASIRDRAPHLVVAIGGGSVLDMGKAVSAMLAEKGGIADYLEGVGKKKPSGIKAPFIAVPTTSGTGSEATKNAVISMVGPEGFKKSLRHDNYLPDAAIVDPELTVPCPPSITAACGMDAFSQLMESYLSTKANPFTDALALSGMKMLSKGFLRSFRDGADVEARGFMSYASFISGFTLAHAGLGTVHGIAGVIGGFFPAPHGAVCGTLLGEVMKETYALLKRENSPCLEKMAAVGRLFDEPASATDEYACEKLLAAIDGYIEETKIPGLGVYGIRKEDVARIVAASDNKNSCAQLDPATMASILEKRI